MDRPKGTHLMAEKWVKYFKIEENGLTFGPAVCFPNNHGRIICSGVRKIDLNNSQGKVNCVLG
jgi:hypothetical protein